MSLSDEAPMDGSLGEGADDFGFGEEGQAMGGDGDFLLGDDAGAAFDAPADDGDMMAATSPAAHSVTSPVSHDDTSKLAAWRTQFREAGEEKDAAEADAKRQRQADAQAALAKWSEQHTNAVDSRKRNNREEEETKNADMLAAIEGDSWERVVSLVDVGATEAGGKDISRMKDVLIHVKTSGIAKAGEASA